MTHFHRRTEKRLSEIVEKTVTIHMILYSVAQCSLTLQLLNAKILTEFGKIWQKEQRFYEKKQDISFILVTLCSYIKH